MNKSTKTKSTANNAKVNATIDFTSFLNDVNALDDNGCLVYGYKNNVQLALAKCGIMVNANSASYVPTDSYVRFKNNAQFQLQYSKSKNQFVGFNIRLCANEHVKMFSKWFKSFKPCVDNQRILKSEFISLDNFSDVINLLVTLPKYNRDVLVPTK